MAVAGACQTRLLDAVRHRHCIRDPGLAQTGGSNIVARLDVVRQLAFRLYAR